MAPSISGQVNPAGARPSGHRLRLPSLPFASGRSSLFQVTTSGPMDARCPSVSDSLVGPRVVCLTGTSSRAVRNDLAKIRADRSVGDHLVHDPIFHRLFGGEDEGAVRIFGHAL